MEDLLQKMLQLSDEAAVLIRRGVVTCATASALDLLGRDAVGKRVEQLLGPTVANAQASAFLSQVQLDGIPCSLRSTRQMDQQVIILERDDMPDVTLGQPFLYVLRTTLMDLSAASDQLRAQAETLQDPALLQSLRRITRDQFRLIRTVRNASMILSAGEGSILFEPRLFDLSALYRSIVSGVLEMMPDLQIRADLGSRIMVRADPGMMKDLLMLLLSNAVIHGKGLERISVTLTELEDRAILGVDDDGCGIEPGDLGTVFDRYRHNSSLSKMGRGSGFGLTVARIIARQHGGCLLLESQPGRGTTVRVTLQRSLRGANLCSEQPVFCETRDLLTGLAGCLPLSSFSELWVD